MKFVRTRGFAKQTMLCAKYDYRMDIAVKKEEAFDDALTTESAAADVGAPLEKVLEYLKNE